MAFCLFLLKYILTTVFIITYPNLTQANNYNILNENDMKEVVEPFLEKELLFFNMHYAGFSIGNKIFIFVIANDPIPVKYKSSYLFEIIDGIPIEYDMKGKLPDSVIDCQDKHISIKDINNDGMPEFIFFRKCIQKINCSCDCYVLDIKNRNIAEGSLEWINDTYQSKKYIFNESAKNNVVVRDFILSKIKECEKEIGVTPWEILYDYWHRNNGLLVSELNFGSYKVKLLWVDFSFKDEFYKHKFTEATINNYKVVSLFRDGVFLIDTKSNKIALIYLPMSQFDWISRIKVSNNNIIMFDNHDDTDFIIYNINEQEIKRNKSRLFFKKHK